MNFFHRCYCVVKSCGPIVSFLSTLTFLLSSFSVSFAEKQDTTDIKMQYSIDEVKVTASGLSSFNQQISRILSVIESKEIELAPAENIQDILEYYVSTDIRGRGAEGVQADAGIRGGTFDQTLILLNGVNISDPQTGHHNLNMPVSLSQIERIEFLNGSSAGIHSPDAFSGAINIITKEPEGNFANPSAVVGSFGYSNVGISGNFKTGEAFHSISSEVKKSDGCIHNTDFNISSIYYSSLIKNERGKMDWQAGLSDKAFGANSFYSPKYADQFEEIASYFISGRWSSSGRLHFTPVIYYRRNVDKFMLFRDNAPDWYQDHNYHRTDTWGGNLSTWFLWPAGKTTVASGYRSENILSSVLGKPLDKPVPVRKEDANYTKSDYRSKFSAYLEHIYFISDWRFVAGGMLNYISGNNGGLYFFPGMELSFLISPAIILDLSWSRAMRLPTYTDMYYSSPTNIGNPLLEPEYSGTLEGGIELKNEYFKGQFTLFYRNGHNMIDWIKYEADDLWQSQNLTEVKCYGAEIQFDVDVKRFLDCVGTENIRFSYYYNDQVKGQYEFISYYALDYLKHKFIASVNQNIIKNFSVNLKGSYQNRAGTYSYYINNGTTVEKSYLPFWLFDLKAMYQNSSMKVHFSINNIFNKKYFDIGNIIQPGIWIKAGFSYKLNFK